MIVDPAPSPGETCGATAGARCSPSLAIAFGVFLSVLFTAMQDRTSPT